MKKNNNSKSRQDAKSAKKFFRIPLAFLASWRSWRFVFDLEIVSAIRGNKNAALGCVDGVPPTTLAYNGAWAGGTMIRKRNATAVVCVAAAIFCASCGPDKPPTESTTSGLISPPKSLPQAANQSDMPVPPADAQLTIICQTFSGPDHIEESKIIRQQLHDGTSMKDWYVVHGNNQSTLYYGFYKSFDSHDTSAGSDSKRALADLDTIRGMTDPSGARPFAASLPVPIDAPDPTANPAWDLARTGAYWSLQIAAFKDSPMRKQAAVEAVRELRGRGIEAYYYHGTSVSSVCIGAWPQEAAREVSTAMQNTNPDAPLYVTPTPLSEDVVKSMGANGVQAVAPHTEPIDPTLIDALQRYPEHQINYETRAHKVIDATTGQEKLEPEHSFLVKIQPRDDSADSTTMLEGGAPAAAMNQHYRESQPGTGPLKSLGE